MPNFIVKINGQIEKVDLQQLVNNMNYVAQQSPMGKTIESIAPDQMSVVLNDNGVRKEIPTSQMLRATGRVVQGIEFPNANPDSAEMGLRFGISNLETDDQKYRYLKDTLEKRGQGHMKIAGTGRDWAAIDPLTGKEYLLTNSPNWEAADLAEAGVSGGKAVAGIGGALAGAASAGVPGSAAGGAAGTAAAKKVLAGLAGGTDESFRKAYSAEEAFLPTVVESGLAAVPVPIARGLGAAGGAVSPGVGRFAAAPVSSTLRGVGAVAQPVGAAAEKAGQLFQKEIPASGAGIVTPVVGDVLGLGGAAQLPPWIAEKLGFKNVAEAGETLGRKTATGLNKVFPKAGTEESLSPLYAQNKGAFINPDVAASIGKDIGTTVDIAGQLGKAATDISMGAIKGGAKIIGGAGTAIKAGGQAAPWLAQRMAPAEWPAAMAGAKIAAEESIPEARGRLVEAGKKLPSLPKPIPSPPRTRIDAYPIPVPQNLREAPTSTPTPLPTPTPQVPPRVPQVLVSSQQQAEIGGMNATIDQMFRSWNAP